MNRIFTCLGVLSLLTILGTIQAAGSTLEAACTFIGKDKTIRNCTLPGDSAYRFVRISSELSAQYKNYQTPGDGPAGILIDFFANNEKLRTVFLAINRPDEDTDDFVTVDLRPKLPENIIIKALQFEGRRQSLTVRVIFDNTTTGSGMIDVWSAN